MIPSVGVDYNWKNVHAIVNLIYLLRMGCHSGFIQLIITNVIFLELYYALEF